MTDKATHKANQMTGETAALEKLDLKSMDVAGRKREELRRFLNEAFPEACAEGFVDFDQLKRALGEWVEPDKERFGLNWPGKADCMKIVQEPSLATLKPMREKSVDFDKTENVFIEGDNLEVLKLLQKSYFGKIKMIYIDPPYNTGNEFIYPDKFSESLETYLAYTGQRDEAGRRFSTNAETSGRYHTNWLNMMYPRLYLAKNLLREDGVIFISIDDHEQANLRELCNDIFGEENFVECFVWKKSYGGGPKEKYSVTQHEYVLAYAKNIAEVPPIIIPYDPKKIERYYKGKDKYFSIRGPYRLKPLEATKSLDARPNLVYGVPDFDGVEIWPKRQWLWGKDRVLEALKREEVIIVGEGENRTLNYKQYLKDKDGEERGEKPFSIIDGIYTQHGTDNIRCLFNDKVVIQFPKPVDLIDKFISIATENDKNAIILDFFSGSATTAHAVMSLNAQDGGNRKFIMVQLPEPCDGQSEAFKAGYKTIADIGRERIRRAGKKLLEERSKTQDGQLALDDAPPPLDIGFRAFRLDRSNFRPWDSGDGSVEFLEKQLRLHIDPIDKASTPEDLLYEIILKSGYSLAEPIASITVGNNSAYSLRDHSFVICLDDQISVAFADELIKYSPSRVVCLDRAFAGEDQLKANLVQTFKNRARNEETEIVFLTV